MVAPMTGMRGDGPGAALDIGSLLRVALEQAPRNEIEARVRDRMVTATTVMELARLLFVAPVQWIFANDGAGDDDGA
jgi:hypothetical protein